jgi:hypothetical protein
MANQYITTDESLEKFQSNLKNKYGSIHTGGVNPYFNLQTINETSNYNSKEFQQANSQMTPSASGLSTLKNRKPDRLTKTIATNLEYYNKIES